METEAAQEINFRVHVLIHWEVSGWWWCFSTWEMTDRFQESSSAIPWGNTKRLKICPALDTGQIGFILNSSGALSKNTGGPGHHFYCLSLQEINKHNKWDS